MQSTLQLAEQGRLLGTYEIWACKHCGHQIDNVGYGDGPAIWIHHGDGEPECPHPDTWRI